MPPPDAWPRGFRRALAAVLLLAFALRLGARLLSGAEDFWVNGYTFYFDLAQSLAHGHGYAVQPGAPTAFRVPLYPLFVAAVTGGEHAFFALVLAQALVGTATVALGARIASELFGARAGLCAACALAVYPYYVVHDTALQETSLFTALTALAVLLLLRVRRSARVAHAVFPGLLLAAAVLTRSTLAPFAAFAPLWLGAASEQRPRTRVLLALTYAAALALGLVPWLSYARDATGAPVLGTEAGYMLWRGHNPHTFSRYPIESMDRSAAVAHEALPADAQAQLAQLSGDELATDRWFARRALAFIADDPLRALEAATRKLGAAFGVLPSPRRDTLVSLAHALSYGPVLALAVLGLALTARKARAREQSLLYALLAWFALTTAVFFGHTSHRAAIDVYLIVFASAPAARLLARRAAQAATAGS